MARRRLLSDEQMAPFWAWASYERASVRHYTLSAADIELVTKRRAGANRLGFAVLLCGMRSPGRVLDVDETPPAMVLAFIADQVGVPASEFAVYRQRPTNRREHIAELMQVLSCRAFDGEASRELTAFAVTLAQGVPRLERLIAAVIEEARKRRVLLPTPRAIDLLCQQARVRSERLLHRALTSELTDATRKSLDGLLEVVPNTATTRLTWLRNASQSPAPVNILGLIERIQFLRELGVDNERRQAIPSGAFDRIARLEDHSPASHRYRRAASSRAAGGRRFVARDRVSGRNAAHVRQADGKPVAQGRAQKPGEGSPRRSRSAREAARAHRRLHRCDPRPRDAGRSLCRDRAADADGLEPVRCLCQRDRSRCGAGRNRSQGRDA